MELKDLAGPHWLTAVDQGTTKWQETGSYPDPYFVDCDSISFTLDGITYHVTEDPQDGYRSSARDLMVTNERLGNQFTAVPVVAMYKNEWSYYPDYLDESDILELVDQVTGKVVLTCGTTNLNDCYPQYVAEWRPENLSLNAGKGVANE